MKRSRGRDFCSKQKRSRVKSSSDEKDSPTSKSVQQPSRTSIHSSVRTYLTPALSQDPSRIPSGLPSSILGSSATGASSYLPSAFDRVPAISSFRDASRTPSGLPSSLSQSQSTQRQLPTYEELRRRVIARLGPRSEKLRSYLRVQETFGPEMLVPPHISESTKDAVEVVRDMYLTLDRLHLHDMVLVLQTIFSAEDAADNPVRLNMSLRASRLAMYLPSQFVNVGRLLNTGAFGEAYLVKTHLGKRYVLKKEVAEVGEFYDDIRRVMNEKNAMIKASSSKSVIKIKGSWYFVSPDYYACYTIMEYADFGTLTRYMELCRPGMQGLTIREGWENADIHGKAAIMEMALNASRDMEDADEDFRKGFRAILLRFSSELIKGVIFLHEEGISHNDLHDGNILIGKGFHIKIADFGLAVVNHPLYAHSLYEYPGQEVAETSGMNLYQPQESVDNDFEYYLNFLAKITSGISEGMHILMTYGGIEDEGTSAENEEENEEEDAVAFLIPEFRSVIYFDEFLLQFSELINQLAMEEGNPTWGVSFENELTIFSTLNGANYKTYDCTQYVLKLYNKASIGFNTKLQSIADIDQNAGWPTDLPSYGAVGGQSRFACVGYMDESFLREAGTHDMYEDDYQPDDEAEVQAS